MKRYIKASTDSDWQSHLPEAVYDRLCMCRSTKKDIGILARAFWNYSHRVEKNNMTERDCLDFILTWVLDWNGGTWDYTDDEYDDWLSQIYGRRKKV